MSKTLLSGLFVVFAVSACGKPEFPNQPTPEQMKAVLASGGSVATGFLDALYDGSACEPSGRYYAISNACPPAKDAVIRAIRYYCTRKDPNTGKFLAESSVQCVNSDELDKLLTANSATANSATANATAD